MPINNPADLRITLHLQGYEATQLASALKVHIRRTRSKKAEGFIPSPGKQNITAMRLQTCTQLLDRLSAAIQQQLNPQAASGEET